MMKLLRTATIAMLLATAYAEDKAKKADDDDDDNVEMPTINFAGGADAPRYDADGKLYDPNIVKDGKNWEYSTPDGQRVRIEHSPIGEKKDEEGQPLEDSEPEEPKIGVEIQKVVCSQIKKHANERPTEFFLAYFGSQEDGMYNHFKYLAAKESDKNFTYYHSNNEDCAEFYNVTMPSLNIFKYRESETHNSKISKLDSETWLSKKKLPYIFKFDVSKVKTISEATDEIVIMFREPNKTKEEYSKRFKRAAKAFHKKSLFAVVDFTEDMHTPMAKRFRVNKETDLPTVRVLHMKSQFKFKFEVELAMLNEFPIHLMGEWIDRIKAQEEWPYIQSEKPKSQKGQNYVMEVVGDQFSELVNSTKVPIVMFLYDSEKKNHPRYIDQFLIAAKQVNQPNKIKFAQLDYAKNEPLGLNPHPVPDYFIIPAQGKGKIKSYDFEHKDEKPDKNEPEQEEEEEEELDLENMNPMEMMNQQEKKRKPPSVYKLARWINQYLGVRRPKKEKKDDSAIDEIENLAKKEDL